MRRHPWSIGLILACWGLGAAAGPQDNAHGPVIRANVRQVLVPVVVTDSKGHYGTGLKASDFQVFEDGVPQGIVAFSTSTDPSTSFPDTTRPDSSQGALAAIAAAPAPVETPRRTYLICVDVLHSAFGNFARVRAALGKFFQQEHSADSQYALIALGREFTVIQDSTRDPAAVLAAIQSKQFMKVIQDSEAASLAIDAQQFTNLMQKDYCAHCACDAYGATTDGPGCPGAKGRAQLFLTSSGERTSVLNQNFLRGLEKLVTATASMPTTHTIVFISDGFNRFPGRALYGILDGFGPRDRSFEFNPRDTEDQLQSVLKVAVRYDVKFYTIDSRGLYAAASLGGNPFDASNGGIVPEKVDRNVITAARENTDALAQLAHDTGGLFFENNNDLFKGVHRAFADGRESYVLAYVPANKTLDGHFRKIEVKVKGKKLQVHAKAGYWATSE